MYWLSGAAWILFSDRFAATIARSPEQLTAVQNYKGWAYVTVTAGLLYWVTVALINRYGAVREKLRVTEVNFQHLIETMDEGMCILDAKARVVFANPSMATLLGVPAGTITPSLMKGSGQPMPRYAAKTGIPADLIRNRPDIRRAERTLAAATAQIGVAESQLYPALTLDGTIGASRVISATTGNLTSWSFGPTLVLPIFNGGALRAQVDIADSQAKQQYIAWKQTVLNAVEEVESAQAALIRDYQTVAALRRLVASNEEALSLARESYKGGASTILDVLDAERNVANSRLTLASSIRTLATDYVELNAAIGGGSAIETPVPTPAPTRVASAEATK